MSKSDSNKSKVMQMLAMQETLNELIDPSWLAKRYPWYRAAWIEAAELMDHIGWKWWKSQEFDEMQAQIEVVDIFHFILSDVQQLADLSGRGDSHRVGFSELADLWDMRYTGACASKPTILLRAVEDYAQQTLARMSPSEPYGAFAMMMSAAGLNIDSLFVLYVGKNTLNIFRQHNGYKEGYYVKTWGGMEDNVWLEGAMKDENPDDPAYVAKIMNRLNMAYQVVKSGE